MVMTAAVAVASLATYVLRLLYRRLSMMLIGIHVVYGMYNCTYSVYCMYGDTVKRQLSMKRTVRSCFDSTRK